MSTQADTAKGTRATLAQINTDPGKINPYIEERIAASPQVTALMSTLAELVPGFKETYQKNVASHQAG